MITLAAAMFLKREELHYFNEIGYEYRLGVHCPLSLTDYYPRCSCDVELNNGNFILLIIFILLFLFYMYIYEYFVIYIKTNNNKKLASIGLDFNQDSCTINMLQYVDKHRIHEIATFARRHFMIADRAKSLLKGP